MRTPVEIDLDQLDWDKSGGLLPAVIQDNDRGNVLMLGYMNRDSLEQTIKSGNVTFYSRSKERLWMKGEESGNVLRVVTITADCDNDAILIRANPAGPTCHTGNVSCFSESGLFSLSGKSVLHDLEAIINDRLDSGDKSSYTRQLLDSGNARIAQKVGEESIEVVIASLENDENAFLNETADLMYHLLVLIRSQGLHLADVEKVLKQRQVNK
jgi:phosphoribosyl-ATP pyrophosphohydrolase/phosphoribosyl-AMP cyclohydrolase